MKGRARHKEGGAAGKIHEWDTGAPEVEQAEDKKETFKKGGRAEHKHGGKVKGCEARKHGGRAARRAEGGKVRSVAKKTDYPELDKEGDKGGKNMRDLKPTAWPTKTDTGRP